MSGWGSLEVSKVFFHFFSLRFFLLSFHDLGMALTWPDCSPVHQASPQPCTWVPDSPSSSSPSLAAEWIYWDPPNGPRPIEFLHVSFGYIRYILNIIQYIGILLEYFPPPSHESASHSLTAAALWQSMERDRLPVEPGYQLDHRCTRGVNKIKQRQP